MLPSPSVMCGCCSVFEGISAREREREREARERESEKRRARVASSHQFSLVPVCWCVCVVSSCIISNDKRILVQFVVVRKGPPKTCQNVPQKLWNVLSAGALVFYFASVC